MQPTISKKILLQLANKYGTPLFVYHANKIQQQYLKLNEALKPTGAKIFYAAKALTNLSILQYVKSLGCNVDCSSINEVKLAILAGFTPKQIVYTSNNISFEEIVAVQKLKVHINIDSLSNLEKFAKYFGNSYPVGIRVRPGIMAGGNIKIATGHEHSKFGIPLDFLPKIISWQKKYQLKINGIHLHTGSELKDVNVFIKAVKLLFPFIPKLTHLIYIDLGGGFKVPYVPGDSGTDVETLGELLKETMDEFQNIYKKPIELWFEPGKFLVCEAGYFLTKVNLLKDDGKMVFAGVDSGFNHLIRPMLYDAYHHIENISNSKGKIKIYTVSGNMCETDNFAENRELNEIREGDILLFYNAGAYCYEMSMQYNSRFRPAEILVEGSSEKLIRRREIFEDLIHTQIFKH